MNPKLVSILKGSAIAAIGAGLAYAAAAFTGSDFGWGPMLGALLAVLANAVRKLATPASPS